MWKLLCLLFCLAVCSEPVAVPSKNDFIKRPNLVIPQSLAARFEGTNTRAVVIINYLSGRITKVEIMKSSGVKAADEVLAFHIFLKFKVKPAASGRAVLPIRIH